MRRFEIRETIEVHVCSECPFADRVLSNANTRIPYEYFCTYNEGRRPIPDPYAGIWNECLAEDGDIV